jgi:tetratricopeptide (TPR) repeat protein
MRSSKLLLVLVFSLLSANARADLRAGIVALRAEKYDAALAEFRAAPDSAETKFYGGVALYKLDRFEEALESLEESFDRDRTLSGEVGNLYLGLTRYALKLYQSSRTPFEAVANEGGSGHVVTLAREHLAAISKLLPAPAGTLSWYEAKGLEYAAARKHRLARAFLDELHALDASYDADVVNLHRAVAANALGHAEQALQLVGSSTGAGLDVQRGQALLTLGRRDEARTVLERAAAMNVPPWSKAARVLLESMGSGLKK